MQVNFIYDENMGKANDDDYLLGKAVDKDFERRGTEGQINAVEYDCNPGLTTNSIFLFPF